MSVLPSLWHLQPPNVVKASIFIFLIILVTSTPGKTESTSPLQKQWIYIELLSDHETWKGLNDERFTEGDGSQGISSSTEDPEPVSSDINLQSQVLNEFVYEPWTHEQFHEQDQWRHSRELCVEGQACSNLPTAPSGRQGHSMIVYETWNEDEKSTYLGTSGVFVQADVLSDDVLSVSDRECPPNCCQSSEACERYRDVLGYEVPFGREFVLMFGGLTREVQFDDQNRSLYNQCETIAKELKPRSLPIEWRSCSEHFSNELWKYDPTEAAWRYMKPQADSSKLDVLSTALVVPTPRAFHGATLVSLDASQDRDGVARKYLYVYGGLGRECDTGVCNDMWRYEIPWAGQIYYPRINNGDSWNRGNRWQRVADGPGSRYGHVMSSSTDGSYILVFGGHTTRKYFNELWKYRVMNDFWELVFPNSISYLSFPVLLHNGTEALHKVEDFSQFEGIDYSESEIVWVDRQGYVPAERANVGAVMSPGNLPYLVVYGGFRTPPSPFPQVTNQFPTYTTQLGSGYYLSDAWTYTVKDNKWNPYFFNKHSPYPGPRRGHSLVYYTDAANYSWPHYDRSHEEAVVLFGGEHQVSSARH
eukprot:GHVQ01043371.1.p1 GENE.GHVQ01043371.1~~GHVQ01043371.1.p1  ORF type:complete len:588 (+),score=67.26 GHVQ01043371.1:245-2008(+)